MMRMKMMMGTKMMMYRNSPPPPPFLRMKMAKQSRNEVLIRLWELP
jgi:hypothetical protein